MRPSTAPCRRPTSEDWTQVDAVLQDMFCTVATASSSSTLPQRPHTACVCAQPVNMIVAHSSDEEEVSDGASIDEDSDDDQVSQIRPSTGLTAGIAWLKGQNEHNGPLVSPLVRPSTAPAVPHLQSDSQRQVDLNTSSISTRSCTSPELPREKALLLGGQLWGKAGSSSPTTPKNEKPQLKETPAVTNSVVRDVAAKAAAKKLPKQCLFLGFSGASSSGQIAKAKPRTGLAPGAARLRPHVSWAHHLPIRTPQPLSNTTSTTASPTPEDLHTLASKQTATIAADVESKITNVTSFESLTKDGILDAVATAEAPKGEPPKRKRGPKYCFAPGGSRPLGAPQKAQRDAMVLEFRTEPRIVPASRAPAKRTEGRNEVFRFRPKSREWATEREVLAMH